MGSIYELGASGLGGVGKIQILNFHHQHLELNGYSRLTQSALSSWVYFKQARGKLCCLAAQTQRVKRERERKAQSGTKSMVAWKSMKARQPPRAREVNSGSIERGVCFGANISNHQPASQPASLKLNTGLLACKLRNS
ncbi:hypothetical protein T01_11554 [Trichinella spiralis]|uniref:Uncharacterized protein n=1 Tax=Trichinella spiralis TaxID=6334 RepID=A0A0V1BY73_TRISP|nr:hypothetical protein T01_11554 [Trichinella spiralis]